LNNDLI